MRLTILGCWAPYPRAGGACSGYLVQTQGANIMLEAGNGSFSNLCRHIDFRNLDALALSHLHPDHYSDLQCIRHAIAGAIRVNSRKEPLRVYMPAEPAGVYNIYKEYTGVLDVVKYEELPRQNVDGLELFQAEVKGIKLQFLPVPHGLPSYAVSIQGQKGRLVFSGDSAPDEALVKLAAGAELFLCEGSGLDADAGYLFGSHHTARQAGEAARQAEAKKLLLTHFWPEYPVQELVRLAAEAFGGFVEPAEENKVYDI